MMIIIRSFFLTIVQMLVLFLSVTLFSYMMTGLGIEYELIKLPVMSFLCASLYMTAIYDTANSFTHDTGKDNLNRKIGIILNCIGLVLSSVQIAMTFVKSQVPEFQISDSFYDVIYVNLIVATISAVFSKWIFNQRDQGRVVT